MKNTIVLWLLTVGVIPVSATANITTTDSYDMIKAQIQRKADTLLKRDNPYQALLVTRNKLIARQRNHLLGQEQGSPLTDKERQALHEIGIQIKDRRIEEIANVAKTIPPGGIPEEELKARVRYLRAMRDVARASRGVRKTNKTLQYAKFIVAYASMIFIFFGGTWQLRKRVQLALRTKERKRRRLHKQRSKHKKSTKTSHDTTPKKDTACENEDTLQEVTSPQAS